MPRQPHAPPGRERAVLYFAIAVLAVTGIMLIVAQVLPGLRAGR